LVLKKNNDNVNNYFGAYKLNSYNYSIHYFTLKKLTAANQLLKVCNNNIFVYIYDNRTDY